MGNPDSLVHVSACDCIFDGAQSKDADVDETRECRRTRRALSDRMHSHAVMQRHIGETGRVINPTLAISGNSAAFLGIHSRSSISHEPAR